MDYFVENNNIKQIDWDKWLYSPGMPPTVPVYNRSLAKNCDHLVLRILEWQNLESDDITSTDIQSLIPEQKIYLLQKLLEAEPLSIDKLKKLEFFFDMKNVQNAELKYRWLRLGIKAKWEDQIQPTLQWISVVGRMKYVRPLYRDLYLWEEARQYALDAYNKNKMKMMHVVAYTVAHDLHLI